MMTRKCVLSILLLFTVFALWGCASSSGNDPEISSENAGDIDRQELEAAMDRELAEKREPTENSPGPIMITLFSVGGSELEVRNVRGTQGRQRKQLRGMGGKYAYFALVSLEWAHQNLNNPEEFAALSPPSIKILSDRAMNKLLTYLEENHFYEYPNRGYLDSENVSSYVNTHFSQGDDVLSLWQGDQLQHRVAYDDSFERWVERAARNQEEAKEMLNFAEVIKVVMSVYNMAPNTRATIAVEEPNSQGILEAVKREQRLENELNVEEDLARAERFVEEENYDRAIEILESLLQNRALDGTTYQTRARALLNEAYRNREQ